MTGQEDLLLFAHLLRKSDKELDLEHAALLIAEAEYPGLDIARSIGQLDALGALARSCLLRRGLRPFHCPDAVAVIPILDLLYRGLGFRGNTADFYDPRNSFLNLVLDRRTGIPITLATVLMGVAKRAGVNLDGVSFPGHFLVRGRSESGSPFFIDPFEGRILSGEEIRSMWELMVGYPVPLDEKRLAPASKRQVIARMLNNLRCLYEVRGDSQRLYQVLSRLAIVAPGEEIKQRLERVKKNPPAPLISIN